MADPNMTQPGTSRLFRGILIVSLALNLVIVGLVAGAALSGRWDKGPRGFDLAAGPVAAALLPEDRQAIRDSLRREGSYLRPPRAQIMAQITEILESLRQDTFDSQALERFFEVTHQRGETLRRNAQDALIRQVISMTPQERLAFADRLEQELMRDRPRQRP